MDYSRYVAAARIAERKRNGRGHYSSRDYQKEQYERRQQARLELSSQTGKDPSYNECTSYMGNQLHEEINAELERMEVDGTLAKLQEQSGPQLVKK